MNEKTLTDRLNAEYKPCVDKFFAGLANLGLSEAELNGIPALFLPGWGDAYESALFKVAIVGKETAYWGHENGDSLLCDLKSFEGGRYDLEASCRNFRNTGPAQWRNVFWQYAAAALGKMFGKTRDDVLCKNNPILRSIAWFNGHAVETIDSKGVDRSCVTPEKMAQIQRLADESGVSDFERFVRVFDPDVILYFYRNGSDDPLRNFPEHEPPRKWGEKDAIYEYQIGRSLVLQMRHTTWMSHGNAKQNDCARLVFEVLEKRGYLSFLQRSAGNMFDLYDMPASIWRSFVRYVRLDAGLHSDLSNLNLSRRLMCDLARELRKIDAKMTARTLVLLLNEVDRFRADQWLYSECGRGPCASVRGAYNAYEGTPDAKCIAEAFTKLNGSYAYE